MPKKAALSMKEPKKPMSPFRVFMRVCLEEFRKRHPEEHATTKTIRSKCKERWGLMNSQEKKRFFQMASEDKARYKMEQNLIEVIRLRGSKEGLEQLSQGQTPMGKLPKKPKRSCSSYILFYKEQRKRVFAANPDFSIGDLSKEVSRLWGELEPNKKAVYVEKAKEDKERYQREKDVYKKGAKSSNAPETEQEDDSDDDDK